MWYYIKREIPVIHVCGYHFLPTLLYRDINSMHGVYASFPYRTASGHIKCVGITHLLMQVRNMAIITVYTGLILTLTGSFPLTIKKRVL